LFDLNPKKKKTKNKQKIQPNQNKQKTNKTLQSIAQLQLLRRTQSEGPSSYPAGRGPRFNVETGLMAAWVGRRRHVTDQQRPDHWLPVRLHSSSLPN